MLIDGEGLFTLTHCKVIIIDFRYGFGNVFNLFVLLED